ncbi:hypothetical protein [Falsiroseomonas oryzae]|nr:hypothetical protein [Roseomonas sp. MO-31]
MRKRTLRTMLWISLATILVTAAAGFALTHRTERDDPPMPRPYDPLQNW